MHTESIYKITLYDQNCSPISDGVAVFFTHNLEEFEKKWIDTGRVDDECHKRFVRSKNGEMVTDYFVDVPELNIVQLGSAEIYSEQEFAVKDDEFYSENAYGYRGTYHVDSLNVMFRWIAFDNHYYRIASFFAAGVAHYDMFRNIWIRAELYGNPVLEYLEEDDVGWAGTSNLSMFRKNQLHSFCFFVSEEFGSGKTAKKEMVKDYENFKITGEIKSRLFADVIGEAG